MSITTRKGDRGYTTTLGGEKVPKYHIVTEAVGNLDEVNSLLGLARASSKEKRIKRILLQTQKHLMAIGSELSVPRGKGPPPKKIISETAVKWLEKLIDDLEEALALPPGFVVFGQEPSAAHMNVARTAVRKAERVVVKMSSERLIANSSIIKYLNRLSDRVFLLACFEEKSDGERQKINQALLGAHWSDPSVRKITLFAVAVILALTVAIVLILIFHRPGQERSTSNTSSQHLQEMRNMHQ